MKYVLEWMLSGMNIILNWVVALAVLGLWLDSMILRFFANLNHSVILSCEANQTGYNFCWRVFMFLTAQNTLSLCWDYALKGNLAPPDLPFTRRAGRGLPQPPGEGEHADAGSKPQGCAGGEASRVPTVRVVSVSVFTERKEERWNIFCNSFPFQHTERKSEANPKRGSPGLSSALPYVIFNFTEDIRVGQGIREARLCDSGSEMHLRCWGLLSPTLECDVKACKGLQPQWKDTELWIHLHQRRSLQEGSSKAPVVLFLSSCLWFWP